MPAFNKDFLSTSCVFTVATASALRASFASITFVSWCNSSMLLCVSRMFSMTSKSLFKPKMTSMPTTSAATAISMPDCSIAFSIFEYSIASGSISKVTTPTITPPAKLSTLPIILLPLFLSNTPITPPSPVPTMPATSDKTKIKVFIFILSRRPLYTI